MKTLQYQDCHFSRCTPRCINTVSDNNYADAFVFEPIDVQHHTTKRLGQSSRGPWKILRQRKALILHVNVARPVQAPRQPQSQPATVYGPHHDTLDVAQAEWKHSRMLHVLTWLCVPLSLRDNLDYSRGVPTDAQPMPIPALVVRWLGPCATFTNARFFATSDKAVPPPLVSICLNGQICNVEAPRTPSTVSRVPTPSRHTSSSAILLVRPSVRAEQLLVSFLAYMHKGLGSLFNLTIERVQLITTIYSYKHIICLYIKDSRYGLFGSQITRIYQAQGRCSPILSTVQDKKRGVRDYLVGEYHTSVRAVGHLGVSSRVRISRAAPVRLAHLSRSN